MSGRNHLAARRKKMMGESREIKQKIVDLESLKDCFPEEFEVSCLAGPVARMAQTYFSELNFIENARNRL